MEERTNPTHRHPGESKKKKGKDDWSQREKGLSRTVKLRKNELKIKWK